MGPETRALVPAVPSTTVRRMAFVLMAAATLATELATLTYGEPLWRGAAPAAAFIVAAAVLSRLAPRPGVGTFRLPQGFVVLLGGLVISPFLLEPLREDWMGNGRPLEVQMVAGFRNLGLGLAALAVWPVCLRLASLVSLFLMLCAVLLADDLRVLPVLAVYSAAGVAWLGLAYWERLRSTGPAGTMASRPPWGVIGAAGLLVGGVLMLTAAGPDRVAVALAELLPTSGGTGRHDPRSRGGVNDGDEETRGENPRSTGFADAQQFLESPLPSLYDSFNDMYGEPMRRDRVEQAIALEASSRPPELPKPPADSLRPGREFATSRKKPQRPRDPTSRAARALFEVDGPTPLHVRAAAFDFYDGVAWHEAP